MSIKPKVNGSKRTDTDRVSSKTKTGRSRRCRLELEKDVFDRWCAVGNEHGFTTGTQIATYLLDRHANTRRNNPEPSVTCMHCLQPMKLVCTNCELQMQGLFPAATGNASSNREDQEARSTQAKASYRKKSLSSVSSSAGADNAECQERSQCAFVNGAATQDSCKDIIVDSQTDCVMENLDDVEIKQECAVSDMRDIEPGERTQDMEISLDNIVLDLSDVHTVNGEEVCAAEQAAEVTAKVFHDNDHIRIGPRKRRVGMKHWLCEDCGDTFNRADSFRFHKMSHTDCRPFACQVCGATFRTKSSLVTHGQTHTNNRPYVCETCACGFKQLASLSRHRRLHSGLRPFACQVCTASFTRRSHLQRHMQKHSTARSHVCDICESAFKDPLTLKKHRTIHLDSEKFVCKECGSSFTRRGNLRRHLKTHLGSKPHVCTECDRAFSRGDHLARHMQTAHLGNPLDHIKDQADDQTQSTESNL